MEKINDLKLVELKLNESQEVVGGYSWLWQAAAGTFLYNVFADWEENVKAFQAGMEAAK
jgi:hypothetical protein